MEDCVQINAKLDMKMVKTLFLCNRQQTAFYLFITNGNKPFRAKDFSAALDIARVSFAPAELMEQKLGTKIGAATVFSALLDTENAVQIVFDRDVLSEEWYGCSDGTTIGYMKIRTEDENFYPIPNIRQLRLRCDMGLYQNRMVIKVGPSTLTNEMGKSDLRSFDRLACTLSDIQNMGHEVILDFSIFWCDCGRNK